MEIDRYEHYLEVEKDRRIRPAFGGMDDSPFSNKENDQDDAPLPPVRRRKKEGKNGSDKEERIVSYLGPIYLNSINSSIMKSNSLTRYRKSYPVSSPWAVMCAVESVGNEVNIKVHPWDDEVEDGSPVDATRSMENECRYDGDGEEAEQREYKNTFSTPERQRIRDSATRFRQQFEDLYNETEAALTPHTLKESGPEVRNTTRIKRDDDTIVYHKKKDELCDDSEAKPEVRASPSATIQKPHKKNENSNEADVSGGLRSPVGISSGLDTKSLSQDTPAKNKVEKASDNSGGFHRKNIKNLSVNIMGVSSESLNATEQSPYYERHSTINSPYNKTTIIHKDPVDPNMSLVCGDGPAVLIKNDYTSSYIVIVAIDFGTMFSGYAFSFTRDPESIHMMRKWEGGDPGINNQKAPTSILITPEGDFDSFGYAARDRYHDLDIVEAKEYLYFEKFKMALHHNADLSKDTMLEASNGKCMLAITVFSYALRFFKEHALQELSDQSGVKIVNDDIRWVITVPAIWKAPAKQFMRQAAYQAGIASSLNPEQLIISLEPEAASIYCRKLRLYQLIPESPVMHPLTSPNKKTPEILNMEPACSDITNGMRYMVVDCGGGTVDITVHEMEKEGLLRELYKATGGAYGGTGVDMEFEKLLNSVFGKRFIDQFKAERPVGWMDLMIAFESRKRSASPYKSTPLNISLPFTFIDYYKKIKKCHVESAIKKYNDKNVRWSTQGMLRLSPEVMQSLFQPTLLRIREAIGNVLNNPDAKDLKYLFLVGGFAESPMLQHFVRQEFGDILKVIIPQGVGLSILKGAVLYGLDPSVVSIRRCRLTYGVGVLNKFDENKHPQDKLFTKDGMNWCSDVFDKFVVINQPLRAGDTVVRSYTPAKIDQKLSIINIYASDKKDVQFITDPSVRKCGTLSLDLSTESPITPTRREIQTIMSFADTEIRMTALDVLTGKSVKSTIDFLE